MSPGVSPARASKFKIYAESDTGDVELQFRFRDLAPIDGLLNRANELVDIVTYAGTDSVATWRFQLPVGAPVPADPPGDGDVFELRLIRPLGVADSFAFTSRGESIDDALARAQFSPYVVPNPYVGSASFEPERFAMVDAHLCRPSSATSRW